MANRTECVILNLVQWKVNFSNKHYYNKTVYISKGDPHKAHGSIFIITTPAQVR